MQIAINEFAALYSYRFGFHPFSTIDCSTAFNNISFALEQKDLRFNLDRNAGVVGYCPVVL